MKKIIAIILSMALLITGMCVGFTPAIAADAIDTTVSPDTMKTATGLELSSGMLVYQNDLNTATEAPVGMFSAYVGGSFNGTSVISDGKWVTGGELGTSSALSGKTFTDFAYGFQIYSPDMVQGNYVHFVYHNTTGWGGSYGTTYVSMSMSGSNIVFGQAAEGSTAKTTYTAGDVVNVIITCKDGNLSTYVWKEGEAVPTTPLLSYDGILDGESGGMYFHTKGNFAFDNFYIYDLNAISHQNMVTATGLALSDNNLVYQNDLNTATEAPVGMFSAYVGGSFNGTSVISDGKWVTGGELGTSTGLSGKALTDFAYGFQFSATNTVSGTTWADFIYHSTTGWGGKNPNNRLNMWISGGKFVFGLYAKESVSQSVTTSYVDGDVINIVMTYVDKQLSAYIWKIGEEVPTTPTLSVNATIESSGDFYFHPAYGTFTFDNFYVYDLADTELYAENIAQATGIELDNDMLVYSNNFDDASEPPVTYFSAYDGESFKASSTISDGKWVTGGTFGTNTGLSKMPFLKNFAYGFQLELGSNDAYARFVYHSTTGWNGSETNNVLELGKSGDNLTFTLYGNDNIDSTALSTLKSSTTTTLTTADKVNIVMTYVDGKVSAYIWKAGTAVPTAPTLTVDALVASSGDFYFSFYGRPLMLDNFYVYDLTSDDSDGVYTTMESSYRMTDTLAHLPLTVEATIKMPTIFTGGAGNTILGNHKYANYTYSLEIDANGHPYVVFDPPWKQRRVMTFDEVDVRTGEWLHLAMVTDITADTVACYVDGVLKQTLPIPTHYDPNLESSTDFLNYNLDTPLYIGRDDRGGHDKHYFKGKIKNMSLFWDMRTADEIKADMSNVAADADNLIADYDFDGCYGTGVKDNSANGYDLVNWGYMDTDPEAPTDYAYSFAVVGDTQILNYHYPEQYSVLYDWLSDDENIENHKIKYVLGLGDITDRDADAEWERAATEIAKLNGKVPYSLVRGNHDSEEKFTKYMTDVYKGQTDGCLNDDINNSYKIFTVGEVDYLVINLNMGAIDAELAWAEELIKTHPNHTVIITTHIYLDSDGGYIDDNNGNISGTQCRVDATANNGDDIWNELVSKYSNISMVLSGHINTTEVVVTKSEGVNGNTVTQMLIDPQCTDESYSAGPTGLVTMLYFSEDGKTVQVRNYSTVRDEYFGAHNQFTMEVDTTDYLYGDVNDDAQIDITDLVKIQFAIDGKEGLVYNKRTANINKDDVIDVLDMTELRKMLIGTFS